MNQSPPASGDIGGDKTVRKDHTSISELTLLFLRLGFTAFGGPAAHIALMKEEVVVRRQWLTETEFLDLLGATNLIPGPNSTEMAIHIGYLRGRWIGLVVAGLCFILPAAFTVSAFAWAYIRFGRLPEVQGILFGTKPVIIAIILQAIAGLVRPAIKTPSGAILAITALVLALLGFDELALLFGAGLLSGLLRWSKPESGERRRLRPLLMLILAAAAMISLPNLLTLLPTSLSSHTPAAGFSLSSLFFFFLKVGSVLYGSGYVLLAFLRDGLVNRWHWLSQAQLLDAVTVGQITPGPVFTTATFIGYILGGPKGALIATAGIFLPSFVFVALSGPLIPRIRKSTLARAFLDGVNVAALALMAAVTLQLARESITGIPSVVLALASAVLLLRYRVNSTWLILGGAVLGLVLSTLHIR